MEAEPAAIHKPGYAYLRLYEGSWWITWLSFFKLEHRLPRKNCRTSMTIKDNLKNLVRRGASRVTKDVQEPQRGTSDLDLALSAVLLGPDALSGIRFPVSHIEFLRHCMEPTSHRVTLVKAESNSADTPAKRFEMLVSQLQESLLAIEYPVAREISLIADQDRSLPEPVEIKAWQWVGDAGLHFSSSSSLGSKGRILFNVIRLMRSERCLELGTAYGMSALFILAGLKATLDLDCWQQ